MCFKVSFIIGLYILQTAMATFDNFNDKLSDSLGSQVSNGFGLNPLSKIINRYYQVLKFPCFNMHHIHRYLTEERVRLHWLTNFLWQLQVPPL